MSIADNIREIKAEVQDALRASGRTDDVTLVAVTKYSGAEAVLEAALAGQTEFAENRVQMLMEKLHALDEMRASGIEVPEINWHLIGHLQTNKVKYIIGKVSFLKRTFGMRSCPLVRDAGPAPTKSVTVGRSPQPAVASQR